MDERFKVGDTITYYDALTDTFASREILFIHEGWAIMHRDPGEVGGRAPVCVTPLESAEPHKADPIKPGDMVRLANGATGEVVAVHGLCAWVRHDEETAGYIHPLSQLDHAR